MTLECFAGVTSIARVGFDGVPALFAQCLEMRVKGEGGNLASLERPTKTITVKWGCEIKEVSECQSWQPRLDWCEISQQNDIALPEDIDRFFLAFESTVLVV